MKKLILIGMVVFILAPNLEAQFRSVFVCWSPCIPDQLLGIMVGFVPVYDDDYFLELKMNLSGIQGTEYDFSQLLAEDFGDEFRGEKTTMTTFRAGKVFQLDKSEVAIIGLYLGIGFTRTHKYLQYYDKYEILDDDGNYYIHNGSKTLISPAFGFMVFGRKLMFKLGLDVNPTGFGLGIGGTF